MEKARPGERPAARAKSGRASVRENRANSRHDEDMARSAITDVESPHDQVSLFQRNLLFAAWRTSKAQKSSIPVGR
jgi:hypothetical protein